MTDIFGILPVYCREKERSVDRLESKRWEIKERPGSLVILLTQDRYEAADFSEELRKVLAPVSEASKCEFGIRPPAKSLSYGDRFVIRVDGTDNLKGIVDAHISGQHNPPHAVGKKSFVELLNDSFEKGHALRTFMNAVLTEWGDDKGPMTPIDFYRLVKKKSDDAARDCPNLHFAIYEWLKKDPQFGPSPEAIESVLFAFAPHTAPLIFSPETPHLLYEHELQLGRLISRKKMDADITQKHIDRALRGKDHGKVFKTLVENSGISAKKLMEWSGFSYSVLWEVQRGGHIKFHHERVGGLINMLNPPILSWAENQEIVLQNMMLGAMATGRPLTLAVKEMVERAHETSNPSVTLFNMLVGPYGKVKLNDEAIAAQFNEKLKKFGRTYSASQIKSRRRGATKIIEREALIVIEIAGCPKKQEEACLEILTGIPGPTKLMDAVESPDPEIRISIQAVSRQLRERKGLSQYDLGINQRYVHEFETREGYTLIPRSGNKMADVLGLQGHDRERYIYHVMGKPIIDVDQVMQQAIDDRAKRPEMLGTMVQWIDVSLETLAKQVKASPRMLKQWIDNGVITRKDPSPVIEAFAKRMLVSESQDGAKFSASFRRAFIP